MHIHKRTHTHAHTCAHGDINNNTIVAFVQVKQLIHTRTYSRVHVSIGLARTIHIRCIYGTFGREITNSTVIYGVYIRSGPTLRIHSNAHNRMPSTLQLKVYGIRVR